MEVKRWISKNEELHEDKQELSGEEEEAAAAVAEATGSNKKKKKKRRSAGGVGGGGRGGLRAMTGMDKGNIILGYNSNINNNNKLLKNMYIFVFRSQNRNGWR